MLGNKWDSRLDTRNVLRHNYVRPTNHKRLHIINTLSSWYYWCLEYRSCSIKILHKRSHTGESCSNIPSCVQSHLCSGSACLKLQPLNPSTEIIGSLLSFNFSTPGNFSFTFMFEIFNPIKKAVLTWKTSAKIFPKIFLVVVQSRHRLLKSSSLYFFSSLWGRLKRKKKSKKVIQNFFCYIVA